MSVRCNFSSCALAVLVVLVTVGASAVINDYQEEFLSHAYEDTLHSTAWWDSLAGELKLQPFVPGLIGGAASFGSARGVTVSGNYAYVADHELGGLVIFDISDPAAPALVGSYDTPGLALSVVVAGNYAYVADHELGGLQVINISNPASPSYAGSYDTPGIAFGLALSGDFAYVADNSLGIQVIDVSDPTLPSFVGNVPTYGQSRGIAVAGNRAYVADREAGLLVLDISNPAAPDSIGAYDTPGNARNVSLSGDYAFVADDVDGGLQIIDISDPENPAFAGTYNPPGSALDVSIFGDIAYLVDYDFRIHMLDISDPTDPQLVEEIATAGHPYGIALAGPHAFVADAGAGLQVYELFAAAHPPISGGTLGGLGEANTMALHGNTLFVSTGLSGSFVAVDISDPAAPAYLGEYAGLTELRHIHVDGNVAYLCASDADNSFRALDISDPTTPVFLGGYQPTEEIYAVCVAGDQAFVAASILGMLVLDVSDPTSPALLDSYDTPGSAWHVTVNGNYAFIADFGTGLQIFDISNTTLPMLAGSFDTPGDARHVAVDGDYAYVADSESGLQVIDISIPAFPAFAGSFETAGDDVRQIVVDGNLAYLADANFGLRVVDVSDPANPTLAAELPITGEASVLAMQGEWLFLSNPTEGLFSLDRLRRDFVAHTGRGQSLALDDSDDLIVAARLAATETSGLSWELSNDDATSWEPFTQGSDWRFFESSGADLHWRSSHAYPIPPDAGNPSCSELSIEWLYGFGAIDAVVDIPEDQGGQVRMTWTRAGADDPGSPLPVTSYEIYRRIDGGEGFSGDRYPPGQWDFLTSIPSHGEDSYNTVLPTLTDSTIVDGMHHSVFFLRAATDDPFTFYDSPPDSGWSADNLAPHVPEDFFVNYAYPEGNELSWEESVDADFQYFKIYRGLEPDFAVDTESPLHQTTGLSWVDADGGTTHFYKISSVDFSGNESLAGMPGTTTGVAEEAPGAFLLHSNVPNPFNPSTAIVFELPNGGAQIRLEVYDSGGRLVRTLLDEFRGAGQHRIDWRGRDDMGRRLGSGLYLCRLSAPGLSQTQKMVMLK